MFSFANSRRMGTANLEIVSLPILLHTPSFAPSDSPSSTSAIWICSPARSHSSANFLILLRACSTTFNRCPAGNWARASRQFQRTPSACCTSCDKCGCSTVSISPCLPRSVVHNGPFLDFCYARSATVGRDLFPFLAQYGWREENVRHHRLHWVVKCHPYFQRPDTVLGQFCGFLISFSFLLCPCFDLLEVAISTSYRENSDNVQ